MRKKFVQIVSLILGVVLLASVAASAAWQYPGYEFPVTGGEYYGIGSQIVRIGIYHGSAGKQSVDLTSVVGDGFQFGYYDNSGTIFYSEAATDRAQITVSAVGTAIAVTDTITGDILYQGNSCLEIEPYSLNGDKTITKCGYPYYGGFRFEIFQGYGELMTIVNMVQLDDYIKGVVPYEMSPSWDIEALKAQAVCARTYALYRLSAGKHSSLNFDLCDSDDCQVYKGVYSSGQDSKVNEAVDSTSGIVMTYDGAYCEAVYSSSNGGASESAVNIWGKDIPYLIGKTDPYEARIASTIPNYNWTKTVTGEDIQAKLIAEGYTGCGVITAVRTTSSDNGNVIALTCTDEYGKSYTIYRNKCRTMLSFRSMRYEVVSDGTAAVENNGGWNVNGNSSVDLSGGVAVIDGTGAISVITDGYVLTANGVERIGQVSSNGGSGASGTVFTFKGTGWGHNCGMSQYGAYAMAQMGYTYKEILEFYYTGVTIGSC